MTRRKLPSTQSPNLQPSCSWVPAWLGLASGGLAARHKQVSQSGWPSIGPLMTSSEGLFFSHLVLIDTLAVNLIRGCLIFTNFVPSDKIAACGHCFASCLYWPDKPDCNNLNESLNPPPLRMLLKMLSNTVASWRPSSC